MFSQAFLRLACYISTKVVLDYSRTSIVIPPSNRVPAAEHLKIVHASKVCVSKELILKTQNASLLAIESITFPELVSRFKLKGQPRS